MFGLFPLYLAMKGIISSVFVDFSCLKTSRGTFLFFN